MITFTFYLINFFRLYLFIFTWKVSEKEGENHQLRHGPWLRTEPLVTFHFIGWHPTNSATLVRVCLIKIYGKIHLSELYEGTYKIVLELWNQTTSVYFLALPFSNFGTLGK